jgi:hypothetical protein
VPPHACAKTYHDCPVKTETLVKADAANGIFNGFGVALGVGAGVAVGEGVGVVIGDGVGVAVGDGEGVGEAVGVGVAVGDGDGVGVGAVRLAICPRISPPGN